MFTFLTKPEQEQPLKKKPKTYLKKPKKSRRHSCNSNYSNGEYILPNDPFINSNSKETSMHSPIKFRKKQESISDEEEQLLLTPFKNDLMEETPHLRNESERKEKASAYFLMFCNICRSFIAIGVLAVPYGFTRSGNKKIF
jgi:methionine aminopeptidase